MEGRGSPCILGQPCHTHGDRKTHPECHPRVGTLPPTPSWVLRASALGLLPGVPGRPAPLEPAPGQGRDRDTWAVGQPQREAQGSGSPRSQTTGDSPLKPWRVLASPHQRCRACSLRLTTSHGLPGAEPRDPAVTPSLFLSLSHSPAPSAGPDTAAQRAGLTLGANEFPGHINSSHTSARCDRSLYQPWLRHHHQEGFPGEDGCEAGMGLQGAGRSRSTDWVCRHLSGTSWHRLCPSSRPRTQALTSPLASCAPSPSAGMSHEHHCCQQSPAEPPCWLYPPGMQPCRGHQRGCRTLCSPQAVGPGLPRLGALGIYTGEVNVQQSGMLWGRACW